MAIRHPDTGETAAAVSPPPATRARGLRRSFEALRMVTASYAIDTLLLVAFAELGSVPASVPWLYAACGLLHLLVFGAAMNAGLGARSGNVSLAMWQTLFTSAVELGFLWWAPGAATLFVSLLFVTLMFGTFALTWRQTVFVMSAIAAGIFGVTQLSSGFGPIIDPSPGGRVLGALVLIVTLARCLVLGLWATSLRAKLDARNFELARALGELDRLATTDHLTGIMNRRSLMAAVTSMTGQRPAPQQAVCVAMLDLDHFKAVNDRFGHLVGDAVLKQFAQIVKAQLRTDDAVGRYGGEEFLVILKHTHAEHAAPALERIREAVTEFDWSVIAAGLQVTVSIGAARQWPGDSLDVLLGHADQALYEAKHAGRNRVEFAAH